MTLSETEHSESFDYQDIRHQFTDSVEHIDPKEFDRNFHEIAKEFRGYLKKLLNKMQSIKNDETIKLTQADRQIINHILEKDPKVKDMEKLFEEFEYAHEAFGTTELQKDIDLDHRTIVSTLAILDRMLKGDRNIWKVIQEENEDLKHFIYGMLAIWLSEHNENLQMEY